MQDELGHLNLAIIQHLLHFSFSGFGWGAGDGETVVEMIDLGGGTFPLALVFGVTEATFLGGCMAKGFALSTIFRLKVRSFFLCVDVSFFLCVGLFSFAPLIFRVVLPTLTLYSRSTSGLLNGTVCFCVSAS